MISSLNKDDYFWHYRFEFKQERSVTFMRRLIMDMTENFYSRPSTLSMYKVYRTNENGNLQNAHHGGKHLNSILNRQGNLFFNTTFSKFKTLSKGLS